MMQIKEVQMIISVLCVFLEQEEEEQPIGGEILFI